jgi:hypothetical protein
MPPMIAGGKADRVLTCQQGVESRGQNMGKQLGWLYYYLEAF